MTDKQNPDSPEYRWLYSGKDGPAPNSGDPEATQRLDLAGGGESDAPPAGARRPDPSSSAGEHTQVLGGHRPEPTTRLPETRQESRHDSPPQSEQAQPAPKPQSFGGTYDAPPRRPEEPPRFAPPADPHRAPGQPPGQPPTRPATKQRPPKRPGRRRNWWLRGILALILVWILFLVVVPIWAWSKISKVDASPDGDRPTDTGGTTYLLVGSDSREGLSSQQRGDLGTGNAAGQRTDTILMLHIPDGDGPNLLLSVPRDSYVDIPGHGKNKINAAYAFGGPQLLVQTIEQNTGIRIDDYIEIGFTGFVDIVDAVGGITVCPRQSINDPKAGPLHMKKGCQEVDGQTALGYSRSRAFSNGDITRTEHQREVISEVGKKAASWSTILLPWRYFKVNKAGAESLRIGDDVGPLDLAKFAWAMAHSGGAKRCVVPFSSLNFTTPDGQSAVLWDEARSTALFNSIRDDDTSGADCDATGQR